VAQRRAPARIIAAQAAGAQAAVGQQNASQLSFIVSKEAVAKLQASQCIRSLYAALLLVQLLQALAMSAFNLSLSWNLLFLQQHWASGSNKQF
jgi:hypothetical protein